MIDYETLRDDVTRALKEVSEYSLGEIETILIEESDVEDSVLEAWERLILNIGQYRRYRKLLGVRDYARLPKEDMERVNVFALHLAKKDPKIILPML